MNAKNLSKQTTGCCKVKKKKKKDFSYEVIWTYFYKKYAHRNIWLENIPWLADKQNISRRLKNKTKQKAVLACALNKAQKKKSRHCCCYRLSRCV